MKKLFLLALCLMLFGVFNNKVAYAADNDLTKEEMAGAVQASFGTQGTHSWGDDDTPLISKVVVPQNGMLTVQIKKTTHTDFGVLGMRFYLYDANGKYLNYYIDETDEQLMAQWKCGLAPGTYYIKNKVEYWSSGAPVSPYIFNFNQGDYYEKEKNDTKETATSMVTDKVYTGEFGNGFSNTESEQFIDESDVYKVYLKKGWTYRVETSKLQGTTLSKFLTKKMELREMFDLGVGKNVVAPYTGYYYVHIYNYGNEQYEYTVNVKTVAPIATSLTKLKAGKKTFTATWKKQNVDGYELSYTSKKNLKKAKVVKVKGSKNCVKVKKLSRKKKYYVRVRTYRFIGGKKYYSKWSKVKKVTVK